MTRLTLVKRRFFDFRYGFPFLSPLIGVSNFVLIAYNFTMLQVIPFEVFVILFCLVFGSGVVFIGAMMRKKQLPTDYKMQYEQSIEFITSIRMTMEGVLNVVPKDSPLYHELQHRIAEHKQLEKNKNY